MNARNIARWVVLAALTIIVFVLLVCAFYTLAYMLMFM